MQGLGNQESKYAVDREPVEICQDETHSLMRIHKSN